MSSTPSLPGLTQATIASPIQAVAKRSPLEARSPLNVHTCPDSSPFSQGPAKRAGHGDASGAGLGLRSPLEATLALLDAAGSGKENMATPASAAEARQRLEAALEAANRTVHQQSQTIEKLRQESEQHQAAAAEREAAAAAAASAAREAAAQQGRLAVQVEHLQHQLQAQNLHMVTKARDFQLELVAVMEAHEAVLQARAEAITALESDLESARSESSAALCPSCSASSSSALCNGSPPRSTATNTGPAPAPTSSSAAPPTDRTRPHPADTDEAAEGAEEERSGSTADAAPWEGDTAESSDYETGREYDAECDTRRCAPGGAALAEERPGRAPDRPAPPRVQLWPPAGPPSVRGEPAWLPSAAGPGPASTTTTTTTTGDSLAAEAPGHVQADGAVRRRAAAEEAGREGEVAGGAGSGAQRPAPEGAPAMPMVANAVALGVVAYALYMGWTGGKRAARSIKKTMLRVLADELNTLTGL